MLFNDVLILVANDTSIDKTATNFDVAGCIGTINGRAFNIAEWKCVPVSTITAGNYQSKCFDDS
jgi:hypothetical protein